MDDLLVTVIIPCYNVEKYIDECLDSIYHQTYRNIEIICVDNNSSDSTYSILSNHKEKHSVTILSESKPGASAARNRGLFEARGDYIQFLDADDLIEKNKIAHQVDLIKEFNVDFIAGAYIARDIHQREEQMLVGEDVFLSLFMSVLGSTCSNLWKKKSLLQISGWNEEAKSSQESDLMFRLIKNGAKIKIDNSPMTIVRAREAGQISQIDIQGNYKRFVDLRIKMLDYFREQQADFFNQNYEKLFQYFFERIHVLAQMDLWAAGSYYRKYVKGRYVPVESTAISSAYLYVYKIFGFYAAEAITKLKATFIR